MLQANRNEARRRHWRADRFARKSPLCPINISEPDGRVASSCRAGTLETLAEISRVNHQSDRRLNRSSTVEAETALGPGLRVGSGLDHAAPESVPNQFSRGL
jgi:hypothetical protein